MKETESLKEIIAMLEKDIEESQRIFDGGVDDIGKRARQINKLKAEWGATIGFRDREPTLRTALLNEHLESYIKQMKIYRSILIEKLNSTQSQSQINNIQIGDSNQMGDSHISNDTNITNNKQSIWGWIVAYVLGIFGLCKG